MGQHRSRVGATLLGSIAVFVASGAIVAASNAAGWDNAIVIGLLAAGALSLIGSLWAFGVFGGLWRLRRSRLQLQVTTLGVTENAEGNAILQLYVRVLNNGRPTRLNRWGLSGQFGGDDAPREAHHIGEGTPFPGRPVLPPLSRETSTQQLVTGEEREGLVWFMVAHTTEAAVLGATNLTLRVHDEKGKVATTPIDIPALEAVARSTVRPPQQGQPMGSFVIGGPGATVRNSSITDSRSNNPDGFGGIYGDTVEDSTMTGNVHDPPSAEEKKSPDDA
jgi:hypothetical protein